MVNLASAGLWSSEKKLSESQQGLRCMSKSPLIRRGHERQYRDSLSALLFRATLSLHTPNKSAHGYVSCRDFISSLADLPKARAIRGVRQRPRDCRVSNCASLPRLRISISSSASSTARKTLHSNSTRPTADTRASSAINCRWFYHRS